MPKRREITPEFPVHTYAQMYGNKIYILATHTYCLSCDRFFDEVKYSIKDMVTEKIHHRVPESLLEHLT